MISHHPGDEMLMDYASGALLEAESLIVATHLALCPACRVRVADLEAMGGALLESLPPEPMADDALDAVMARLDRIMTDEDDAAAAECGQAVQRHQAHAGDAMPRASILVPDPLRSYLGTGDLDALPWRGVMRGLEEMTLDVGRGETKTRMLRIAPGVRMPQHTHHGHEMTLVLTGSFFDERGHFIRGDMAVHDHDVDHQPTADDDQPCVCLTVTDGPLKLTGRFGRLLNPFVRF